MVTSYYPLVNEQFAIENGTFVVDLPFFKVVIFHMSLYVYQRVKWSITILIGAMFIPKGWFMIVITTTLHLLGMVINFITS